MDSLKLTFAALIFVSCQAGHAQDAPTHLDESQVKKAVQELTVQDICPNPAFLELAEIEMGDCRSHIAIYAPVCWHIMDPIVVDYEIEGGGKEKNRFLSIAHVYASCVRGELLREIVKSRREQGTK